MGIVIGTPQGFDYSKITSTGNDGKLQQLKEYILPTYFPKYFSNDHLPDFKKQNEFDRIALKHVTNLISIILNVFYFLDQSFRFNVTKAFRVY